MRQVIEQRGKFYFIRTRSVITQFSPNLHGWLIFTLTCFEWPEYAKILSYKPYLKEHTHGSLLGLGASSKLMKSPGVWCISSYPRESHLTAYCRSRLHVKLVWIKKMQFKAQSMFMLWMSVTWSYTWKFNLAVSTKILIYINNVWNHRQTLCVFGMGSGGGLLELLDRAHLLFQFFPIIYKEKSRGPCDPFMHDKMV